MIVARIKITTRGWAFFKNIVFEYDLGSKMNICIFKGRLKKTFFLLL